MSLRALQSAGTGMAAFQFNLDTIANNLAASVISVANYFFLLIQTCSITIDEA